MRASLLLLASTAVGCFDVASLRSERDDGVQGDAAVPDLAGADFAGVDLASPPRDLAPVFDLVPPPSHCLNNMLDIGETDIDCGNTCPKCADGKKCGGNADCASNLCTNGICAGSCPNAKLDGNETDIDCGGGSCAPCVSGKMCKKGTDCSSQLCFRLRCTQIGFSGQTLATTAPASLAAAPIDGNGGLDLAVANGVNNSPPTVTVLGNGGMGNFMLGQVVSVQPNNTPPTGQNPAAITAGRGFDDPAAINLATANNGGNAAFVTAFLLANGMLVPVDTGPWAPNVVGVAIANFDSDVQNNNKGTGDIAGVSTNDNGCVRIHTRNFNSNFMGAGASACYQNGVPVKDTLVTADLNGDAVPDLALATSGTNAVHRLFNMGNLFFQNVTTPLAFVPTGVAVGSLDNDMISDAVVAGGTSFQTLPSGSLGLIMNAGMGISAVAILDANGDGKGDVAVADALTKQVIVFLGDSAGTFVATPPVTLVCAPTRLVAADFSGDNRQDLAAACAAGNVIILTNVSVP